MISRTQLVLLLAGLALGPGYIAYAELVSGSTVVQKRLAAQGQRTLPAMLTVTLEPDMGTVAVYLRAGHRRREDSRARGAVYEVALHRGDERLARGRTRFELAPGRERDSATRRVMLIREPRQGTHRVTVERLGPSEPALTDLELSLRRNVIAASPRLYSGGLILFFGTIVWILFAGRPARE